VALFALRTADGARTWGRSTDPALMAAVMEDEAVGRGADLDGDGRVRLT
jgi:hypothetical protein